MRKNVLMTLVLMAAMTGTALAAKQTAFCPYDGQIAQWTVSQKGASPNQVVSTNTFSSTPRPNDLSNMFSGMHAITSPCAPPSPVKSAYRKLAFYSLAC